MQTVLEASIHAGEATTRTAERLLDVGRPSVELPQYVRELSGAAKFPRGPGDPNLYEDALKKWHRQIDRLGQGKHKQAGDFTIRSATQQLVIDLQKAKPEQVDKIVDRWIVERARHQARVVARNEAVEAFRDVALANFKDQPWCPGVKWSLSPLHPHQDICDVLAAQNLYGLGRGCYPVDRVPGRHTSDLCTLSAIADVDYFQRELAKLRGEPEPPKAWEDRNLETGEEWLLSQSPEVQREIAGPTRTRLLNEGKRIMARNNSEFRPVYKLLKKPKPEINRGPRVDATGPIDQDRLGQRTPFPDLQGIGKIARPPAPKPRVPKPVHVHVAPPAPAPPPKPPLDVLKKATNRDEMRGEFAEIRYRAQQSMRKVGDQYVGPVPAGPLEYSRRVQADVASHFGLPISTPITDFRALPAPSRGIAGTMSSDGVLSLKMDGATYRDHHVIVHESIHTMGGAATPGSYRGIGAVLEEVSTEDLAQSYAGSLPKLVSHGEKADLSDLFHAESVWKRTGPKYELEGSYVAWREKAHRMIAVGTGEYDASKVSLKLRETAIRWKQQRYATKDEATRAFIEALDPKTQEQRNFYQLALDSDWGS